MKLSTALLPILLTAAVLHVFSEAIVVEVVGIVDGGTVSLVRRAVDRVSVGGLLILYVDSYGGYLASADSIVEYLISSDIECVVYIPPGGKAVSAAALIAVACGRIYMASGSVIGAARPQPDDPKVVNYVASRFRALASKSFRNESIVKLVEKFATESLTLTDEEAAFYGIARKVDSLDDVLRDLNSSKPTELLTKDLWDGVLSVISDPLIYSLAISLGLFLVVAEVLVTGFQGYAIAGVLLIAIALYGMSVIPPDILVLTLMLSGALLVLVEFLSPGLQGFSIAGLALLTLGLYLNLRSRPTPALEPLAIGVAVALSILGVFLGFIMLKASQAIRLRKPKLREVLVGSVGVAKTDVGPTTPGVVYILGEDWTAYSLSGKISAGSRVVVRDVRGLFLYIERLPEEQSP